MFLVCFVCLFIAFQGHTWDIWTFPGEGLNKSYSLMTQAQQHQISIVSVAYTTAHVNARCLTHWARPGIKPTSSWVLVGLVSTEPQREHSDLGTCLKVDGLKGYTDMTSNSTCTVYWKNLKKEKKNYPLHTSSVKWRWWHLAELWDLEGDPWPGFGLLQNPW